MKSSTGQIKLPSTLDMGTTVPIAITGWEQSGMQHNINLSVPRQGDRNELLAKVAKRAERAQLLVLYYIYYACSNYNYTSSEITSWHRNGSSNLKQGIIGMCMHDVLAM